MLIRCLLVLAFAASAQAAEAPAGLTIKWEKDYLTIEGARISGGPILIHYLEAYVRPGSTDADWRNQSKIDHKTELISASDNHKQIKLRCTVRDGVIVDHVITAGDDEVDFRLTARNPTGKISESHWAQPCVRLGPFTGFTEKKPGVVPEDYLPKCFIFLDGQLSRMPTKDWATKARYVPGQVWCPKNVPRTDVNPRPLNPNVPSNGVIGCFSADEKTVFATAWEPYQELFQGVARCLHSDFRIGPLEPGQTKEIRGKIYIVPAEVPALLKRYEKDFPEQVKGK